MKVNDIECSEKTRLSEEPPNGGRIGIRGRVSDVAYYGNESHILLETDTGVQFTTTVQNEARRTDSNVLIGDELWITWSPEDTLVLSR